MKRVINAIVRIEYECESNCSAIEEKDAAAIDLAINPNFERVPIVSIAEQDGEKGVRLCVGDIDIFIEAHDLDEDGKEFMWDEAMKKLKAYGKRTFDKHEMYLIAAFKDEINAALREIGGAELDNYYWSSTEYNSNNAWYVYFSSGGINYYASYYFGKYYTYVVRPVAAFKHE